MKIKKEVPILWLVVQLLALSVCFRPDLAVAQTPVDVCALAHQLSMAKQLNVHAYQVLVGCRLVPASQPIPGSSAFSFPNFSYFPDFLTKIGMDDIDVVLGGEGSYPNVTQSETQTWTQGNTSVVAYNDSRTAPACYGGGSYSIDRGTTWTNLNSRPFCTGHGINYGDPVMVYDKKHAKWLATMLADGCGGQGLGTWSSTNGITWSVGACAHSGASDDRESGWVDNSPLSPFYGRVYLSWNDFNFGPGYIFVTWSDDGGATWHAPVQVEADINFMRNVQLTTGPDGTVFIASMDEGGGVLNPRQNFTYRSTNGGSTWSRFSMGPTFAPPGLSTCGYFAAMFPSYWRHMGWGDIGAASGGVIHYVYAQGGTGADAGDIYYTRSTNNGSTWSAGIKLNTDSGSRSQWQPSLSVSPTGHVFVSWYDARNTMGTDYERWGRISNDNGATWQADDLISNAISPLPLQPDPNVQSCYAGDYDRSFADSNDFGIGFFGAWVDGRVAISGTPQQDVFFNRAAGSITDLVIDFGTGTGIWARYNNGASWGSIHSFSAKSMIAADVDGNGKTDLVINFGSAGGIWAWLNNATWVKIHNSTTANSMVAADVDHNGLTDLVIDFGTGIWARYNNGASWGSIHSSTAKSMVAADVDGNGQTDLVINFGSAGGIWAWLNNATWSLIHGSTTAKSMVAADVDHNGVADLVIDFGIGTGIWARYNNGASWGSIHSFSAKSMVAADVDANGTTDLVIDFGTGTGIWARYNNGASWRSIHHSTANSMIAADVDGK